MAVFRQVEVTNLKDPATDSVPVTEVAPAMFQTLAVDLFNAATSTGVSSLVNLELFKDVSVQATISNTATIEIQTSNNGTNFLTESIITGSQFAEYQGSRRYLRAVISSLAAGNVTLNLFAKT